MRAGSLAVCAAGLLIGGGAHAAAIVLVAHRAVYDLSLAASGDGGTVAASGNMSFAVHDTCRAWATEQTLTINSVDRDGHQTATRSDYATFESKDGRLFDFTMHQMSNGKDAANIRGEATEGGAGAPGVVRFSQPAGLVLTLPPGTLFPMTHTRAVLQAASSGKRSLAPVLFDGTGTDGPEYTYATVVRWGATSGAPITAMADVSSGRIHIAFYPLSGHGIAPEYEIGSRYFANGVSDRLDMDFGDYRLAGTLQSLKLLPQASGCGK